MKIVINYYVLIIQDWRMKVNEKYYHIIILINQSDKSYHKYRITYNYTVITNKNIFIKHKIIPHLL